jgi:hypothetical protein
MGLWSILGKVGAGVAAPFTGGASLAAIPAIDAIGAGLGAASQGMASNRGAQFQGQLDLERLLMQRDQNAFQNQITREQEGRAGQSDAFRKMFAAQRVSSPAARPNVTPYAAAPRMATGAELSGADALTQQVLARLQGGNPISMPAQRPMNVDPRLLKAGKLESIFGLLSPALGAYSAIRGANNG